MKKIYQKPEFEVLLVAQTLLQTSGHDEEGGDILVKEQRGGSWSSDDDWDE